MRALIALSLVALIGTSLAGSTVFTLQYEEGRGCTGPFPAGHTRDSCTDYTTVSTDFALTQDIKNFVNPDGKDNDISDVRSAVLEMTTPTAGSKGAFTTETVSVSTQYTRWYDNFQPQDMRLTPLEFVKKVAQNNYNAYNALNGRLDVTAPFSWTLYFYQNTANSGTDYVDTQYMTPPDKDFFQRFTVTWNGQDPI